MKIAHLSTDNKFLDYAIPIFEAAYPNSNDVFLFSKTPNEIKSKSKIKKIIKIPSLRFKLKPLLKKRDYESYDVIVLHSLTVFFCKELINTPKSVPVVWLGWGFDYYDDYLSQFSTILESTKKIQDKINSEQDNSNLKRKVISPIKSWITSKIVKRLALKKVTTFSPVIPNEYFLISERLRKKNFPILAPWNYGTIEDNYIKGFSDSYVKSNNILIGNSASFTNNHMEAFQLLRELNDKNPERKLFCPLSYGDNEYARCVIELGEESFGSNFYPLTDFMPIEAYLEILYQCSYVIMNHVRQQAVGNIVIMLYLGARVFIREENPVYIFLKSMGVNLSTIQELKRNPELLDTPLSDVEKKENRDIVNHYWSREEAVKRTKELVNKALEIKKFNSGR